MGHIHAEQRRRGVTLALLWEEYRGYGYSRYVAPEFKLRNRVRARRVAQ
jgi:hypothetical protein